MIQWLEKTPDFLVGTALAGSIWFGFNYAVLAERAMKEVIDQELMPTCQQTLVSDQEQRLSAFDLPLAIIPDDSVFGFKGLFKGMTAQLRIGDAERQDICLCSVIRHRQSAKFDYAVHTASFRFIEPAAVTNLRDNVMTTVTSQACGALPWRNIGVAR